MNSTTELSTNFYKRKEFDDDWGFYVDIEEEYTKSVPLKQEYTKSVPLKQENHIIHMNDYYDYYDSDYAENYVYEYDYIPEKKITNILIKVSSTTLATIGITYIVFCLL
jgi:hypothetical protein